MYNYLWVVYQSEEPVLESGAADIGAVVATIDAVTLKWDELNWKLFPRLRLHGKRGDFDYSYMKRGCHYHLPRVRAPAPIPRGRASRALLRAGAGGRTVRWSLGCARVRGQAA